MRNIFLVAVLAFVITSCKKEKSNSLPDEQTNSSNPISGVQMKIDI